MPRYALKGGFTAGLWPTARTVFRTARFFAFDFFFSAPGFAFDFFFAAPGFAEGFRAVVEDFTVFVDGFFFRPLLRVAVFDAFVLPAPAEEEVGFATRVFEGDLGFDLEAAEDEVLRGDCLAPRFLLEAEPEVELEADLEPDFLPEPFADFLAEAEAFFLVGDFFLVEAFFTLLFFPAIEPFSLFPT